MSKPKTILEISPSQFCFFIVARKPFAPLIVIAHLIFTIIKFLLSQDSILGMAYTLGLFLCLSTRRRIAIIVSIVTIAVFVFMYFQVCLINGNQNYNRIRHNYLELDGWGTTNRSPSNCCYKGERKRFPDVVIIGVKKGGTRALIDMLKSHPEIVAASNEVHYFDREENFQKGVQWYIDQMPYSLNNQITIEKSPSYFISSIAAQRMSIMSPNIKLILIVRNPIDRAISDYTQLLYRKEKYHGTFEGAAFLSPSGEINTEFSPISVSMYDIYIKSWLKYFDLNQLHIVDGDTLINSPIRELKRAEKFLSVSNYFTDEMFYFNTTKGFYCWKKTDKKGSLIPYCLGSAKGRQHPHLSNSTLQRLHSFFDPHTENFFLQVKKRFNWGTR